MFPTNHQWHETIEITHGFNDWFEVGFYIFTAAQNGHGLGLGRRPHPASRASAEEVELARGG